MKIQYLSIAYQNVKNRILLCAKQNGHPDPKLLSNVSKHNTRNMGMRKQV